MTTSKHTPGPWRLNGREIAAPSKPSLSVAYVGKGWCAGVDGSYGIGDDEANANARLIAAAPELLAALKDCLTRFVEAFPGSEQYGPIKAGFAAIAKAEGTSPEQTP